MADLLPFDPIRGVTRDWMDADEQEQTAAWTVEDPRRLRSSFFDGRFLTARDLTREQQYALIRQADLGQASGGGVVSGLQVVSDGTAQLVIKPGTGLTPSGETVILREEQRIDVTRMPVAERFGEEPTLALLASARVGTRSGVFALCLRAVEYTARPTTAYPTSVQGKRTQVEGDVVEATAVVFLPITTHSDGETKIDARAQLASEVFVHGGALKLAGTVLPLAAVLLEAGQVIWVDPFLVRRELGADLPLGFGLAPRSTRVAYWWQFGQHLADVVQARIQRSVGLRFQAREHFKALPPFGFLPRQCIDVADQQFVQWFFPQEMPLELSIVPSDEVPGLLEESLTLPAVDLGAPTEALQATPILILVSVPRSELSRLSLELASSGTHISERTARPTAHVTPIDALAALWQRRNPTPPAPARPVDLAPWRTLLNRTNYVYFMRRRQFSPVSYAVPRYARVADGSDPIANTTLFTAKAEQRLVLAEERQNLAAGSRKLARFDLLMRRASRDVWVEAGKLFNNNLFDTRVAVNGAVAELAYRARVRVRDLAGSNDPAARGDRAVRVRALRVEDVSAVAAHYQFDAAGWTKLVNIKPALDDKLARTLLASTLLVPELFRAASASPEAALEPFATALVDAATAGKRDELRKLILARVASTTPPGVVP